MDKSSNSDLVKKIFEIDEKNVFEKNLTELREAYKILFGSGSMKQLALEFGKNSRYATAVFAGDRNNRFMEETIRKRIYEKLFHTKNFNI
jgi:hypothetical protein